MNFNVFLWQDLNKKTNTLKFELITYNESFIEMNIFFLLKQMSLVFINNPDEFYLDLLFIGDSKYISKQIPETIIAMFYNPAYHRVFL